MLRLRIAMANDARRRRTLMSKPPDCSSMLLVSKRECWHEHGYNT
jgi:hypothetical protein